MPRASGASSLVSNSSWSPRQIPITGRPAAATSRTASPRPVVERFRVPWPKLPTPGTSTRSAARTSSGSAVSVPSWPPASSARTTLFRLFTP